MYLKKNTLRVFYDNNSEPSKFKKKNVKGQILRKLEYKKLFLASTLTIKIYLHCQIFDEFKIMRAGDKRRTSNSKTKKVIHYSSSWHEYILNNTNSFIGETFTNSLILGIFLRLSLSIFHSILQKFMFVIFTS